MAENILALKGEGNVDVQPGGPGNNWYYLSACASMSGPSVPTGGTEIRWCQDPNSVNGFKISSKFKTNPDQIGFDLMTKLGKIDYLEDLNCEFSLRARFTKCSEREDSSQYDPLMLTYCGSEIQEHSYDDLVVTDAANNDEILVTAPVQANYEYRIKKINPSREGTASALGDQPINDIEYCDEATCGGYCGDKTDGCSIIWGVTDADTTPYASPNLIKGVKNNTTGLVTWTNTPILGINGNVDGIECAGNRLIVSSNADGVIAYNDNNGDQDEWNVVSITNAPTANPNALFARTAREIWLAANSGFVYKSVDGGQTWSAMHQAEISSQNFNAVFAYDKDLVYAVGNNGVMIKSENGGSTWTEITETSTTGANLIKVGVPPNRPKEVYIGTNNGMIYRSKNAGGTEAATGDFSEMTFTGQGVGTVDDFAWCGPCAGDVMWILHNDAGPRARILRDLSGGAGGADVEIVMNWLDVIPTGIDLNALACCNVNTVIAAGENYDSYPVVIEAS